MAKVISRPQNWDRFYRNERYFFVQSFIKISEARERAKIDESNGHKVLIVKQKSSISKKREFNVYRNKF